MVCAGAPAAASASPTAAANAADLAFLIVPPPIKSLPGAVVDRSLEGRPRLDQAPAQCPLIGVIEALAGIGLGRRVDYARELEIFRVQQAACFLDQVARVLARI